MNDRSRRRRFKRDKLLWTMAIALICSASVKAQFVAYNDFGGTSGTNVTSFTLSQSGLLKDYSSGANTAVTLNVVPSSPAPATDTGVGGTPTGGDANAIFGGIVNLAGYIWYASTPTPYTSVRLDFTGLNSSKTYELVLSANRNGSSYTGSNARYTRFTISDMSTFTNSHSSGTTLQTVNQTNDSVKVETGYNTLTGYVCQWTGITSGADGDISVNVTAPTGTGGGGDGKWYLGGMRLTEVGSGQKILTVEYPPYLQLGNAPLANTGGGIGSTDQIVIAWQTKESGSGSAPNDYFEAEYRLAGGGSYTAVTPVSTLNTGSGTRVNRWVTITGLSYNTNYEYRVHHKRNPGSPVLVNTYTGTFKTRRTISDYTPFSFAAYGDAAQVGSNSGYESVINRITILDSTFVTLLGDNVYDSGTHDELDAIFDPAEAPNSSAYIRNRILYFAMGNHDAGTSSGQPSLDDFFCPIPALGSTSPVSPPSGETAEKNYSFDHGSVHFAVIDSTAWGGPGVSTSRQSAIINWLSADLNATAQPWKIVIAHHPPKSYFGHSDTGEGMAAELVPVLISRGVSLLLVGHSHNYQRSFPITGYSGSNVTWTTDSSGIYSKAGNVIEIVAGTGGRPINSGAPTSAVDWLAKALGTNNGGEYGPLIVDVGRTELRAKWTAADDGAIKDEITIYDPDSSLMRSVDLGSPDLNDGLSHYICCDGSTTPTSIGGRTARVNVDNGFDDYFYFRVSDGFALNGNKPNMTIMVDYFDKDTGTLTLQYDATSAAYKNAAGVVLTNTNTWKTATWQVTDAYFGNRQNGSSDFRVHYSGNDFYLDIVSVNVTSGPPAAPTVTAPSNGGTVTSLTPTITWSGDSHTGYQVRVSQQNDSNTSTNGWDSGDVTSSGFSAVSGTLRNYSFYYVFVRLRNAAGWGPWSAAGRNFIVNTNSVNGTVYLGDALPSVSGWNVYDNGSCENGCTGITSTIASDGGSNVWQLVDASTNNRSKLRYTNGMNISFDTGASCASRMRATGIGGSPAYNFGISNGNVGGMFLRLTNTEVRLIDINNTNNGSFLLDGTVYHKYQLTVKNATAGNNATATWRVYVDGTLRITFTGAGTHNGFDGFMAGHAGTSPTGTWRFDSIGCRGDGEFAPTAWDPVY